MRNMKILSVISLASVMLLAGCNTAKAEPIAAVVTDVDVIPAMETAQVVYEEVEPVKLSGTIFLEDDSDDIAEKPAPRIPLDRECDIFSTENTEYSFSDDYIDFLSRCTFVGDSICSGLSKFGILPKTHVCALGNVGTHNIFEDWVTFPIDNAELDVLEALKARNPEYVVCSMGMNDVNLVSVEAYLENYDNIISEINRVLPEAKVIVLSITPVTYRDDGKIFTYNSDIDAFNAAMQEHCIKDDVATFVNIATRLKTSDNLLDSQYRSSADGVHLAKEAYYPFLYQLCEYAVDGIAYEADGSVITVRPVVE